MTFYTLKASATGKFSNSPEGSLKAMCSAGPSVLCRCLGNYKGNCSGTCLLSGITDLRHVPPNHCKLFSHLRVDPRGLFIHFPSPVHLLLLRSVDTAGASLLFIPSLLKMLSLPGVALTLLICFLLFSAPGYAAPTQYTHIRILSPQDRAASGPQTITTTDQMTAYVHPIFP